MPQVVTSHESPAYPWDFVATCLITCLMDQLLQLEIAGSKTGSNGTREIYEIKQIVTGNYRFPVSDHCC